MSFLSKLFSRKSSSDRKYNKYSHRGSNHYCRGYKRSSNSSFSGTLMNMFIVNKFLNSFSASFSASFSNGFWS